MVCLYNVEHYLAMKRDAVWTHAATCTNPRNFVPSERSQSPKGMYCRILLTCNGQNRQIYRDRIILRTQSGARGWERAEYSLAADGYRVLFGLMKIFLNGLS